MYYEDLIVKYLQTHRGGLTVRSCQELFGTTELRRIICTLKEKGYRFTDVWETGVNRLGMNVRYKRYWLLKSPSKRGK